MTGYVPPSIELKSFSCPHCGALAHQTWFSARGKRVSDDGVPYRATQSDVATYEEAKDIPTDVKARQIAYVQRAMTGEVFFETNAVHDQTFAIANVSFSRCYSCQRESVWIAGSIVYPSSTKSGAEPNRDLPAQILRDYDEARSILDYSPRSAAALLRLCVQKLCIYLGQPGKNINDDIAALVKAGLDARVQRALDIVRVVGNESVHPGTMDLNDDRETASKLFGLVNLIAEKMITEPKHVEELYGALPESKRKAIEDRDRKP